MINNLPGLVKRELNDLQNIREDNIGPSVESVDGILNNLEGKIKPYDSVLCFYVVSKYHQLIDWLEVLKGRYLVELLILYLSFRRKSRGKHEWWRRGSKRHLDDEQRGIWWDIIFSILFFASFSGINKHFCYKKRRQIIQQTVEGATSDNRVYLLESKTHWTCLTFYKQRYSQSLSLE